MQKAKTVDDYYANAAWRDEIAQVRKILLATPLTEELKWGAPCYTFNNQNVVAVASFKFATSIAGLGSSIILGIAFRSIGIRIETAFSRLCQEIEIVLLYLSQQSQGF